VIRLITGINKYESCRQKLKENRILTVTSVYILEVLCYIKKYKGDLKHNCKIHEYNTRSKYDLHTVSQYIFTPKQCATYGCWIAQTPALEDQKT
jgi:hypothetical protein